VRPASSPYVVIKHGDGTIACRLYNTDVVTFKPNGEIAVLLNGWTSESTCDFAAVILETPFYKFDSKVWCRVMHEDKVREFPLRTYGENLFYFDRLHLKIKNPLMHRVHKINRTGANNVRKRYQSFRDYLDRVMRLREDERGRVFFSDGEFREVFKEGGSPKFPLWIGPNYRLDAKYWAEFQQLIEDHGVADKTQDFYKAWLWLVSSTNRYREHDFCVYRDVLKLLDEAIFFLHRGEVFDEIDCWGEEVKDNYAGFFS
jgi:hypothetical protein